MVMYSNVKVHVGKVEYLTDYIHVPYLIKSHYLIIVFPILSNKR